MSAASCARFEPLDSTSSKPSGVEFAVRQCLGRRVTDLGDVVVESANQLDVDLGAVHALPRRQRRQGGSPDRS